MLIEVVKAWYCGQTAWVMKGTTGGRVHFWTGYGWTMGGQNPKFFEEEDQALEEVMLASGYVVDY